MINLARSTNFTSLHIFPYPKLGHFITEKLLLKWFLQRSFVALPKIATSIEVNLPFCPINFHPFPSFSWSLNAGFSTNIMLDWVQETIPSPLLCDLPRFFHWIFSSHVWMQKKLKIERCFLVAFAGSQSHRCYNLISMYTYTYCIAYIVLYTMYCRPCIVYFISLHHIYYIVYITLFMYTFQILGALWTSRTYRESEESKCQIHSTHPCRATRMACPDHPFHLPWKCWNHKGFQSLKSSLAAQLLLILNLPNFAVKHVVLYHIDGSIKLCIFWQ